MKVSKYLLNWVSNRASAKGLKPRTVDCYADTVRKHIIPAIGSVKLRKLSAGGISAMLAAIVADGKSRTAELVYTVLRTALSDAVRAGLLHHSPMEEVPRPQHRAVQYQWLHSDQIAGYVAAAAVDRNAIAWLLALCCGLRRGELCGLRWSDIDLQHNLLHIRNQRQRLLSGQVVDISPKSGAGNRTIPLPPELVGLLLLNWQSSGYVCQSMRGAPYTPSGLDQAHASMLRRAGLQPVTLHGIRHTMGTQAISAGVHIKVLQQLLGHSSYITTAKYYAHVDMPAMVSAIDGISAAVLSYSGRVST